MSSIYRILCLSHDPAIVLDSEFRSASDALAVVSSRSLCNEVAAGHHACDLVVGAYSYPLVRVWCPPCSQPRRAGHSSYHPHGAIETEAFWLRLLWHAYQQEDGPLAAATAAHAPGCWSKARLHPLRHELGTGDDL